MKKFLALTLLIPTVLISTLSFAASSNTGKRSFSEKVRNNRFFVPGVSGLAGYGLQQGASRFSSKGQTLPASSGSALAAALYNEVYRKKNIKYDRNELWHNIAVFTRKIFSPAVAVFGTEQLWDIWHRHAFAQPEAQNSLLKTAVVFLGLEAIGAYAKQRAALNALHAADDTDNFEGATTARRIDETC